MIGNFTERIEKGSQELENPKGKRMDDIYDEMFKEDFEGLEHSESSYSDLSAKDVPINDKSAVESMENLDKVDEDGGHIHLDSEQSDYGLREMFADDFSQMDKPSKNLTGSMLDVLTDEWKEQRAAEKKSGEDLLSENTESDNIEADETDDTEKEEKKGGSYGEVFKEGEGDKYQVHHMPADSASNLERNDGPAIKMERDDHRQTASCGSSREAREYREQQRELIGLGKFREALQMDIDDIHEKFGDKYDDAIQEMLDYVDQLEGEGMI